MRRTSWWAGAGVLLSVCIWIGFQSTEPVQDIPVKHGPESEGEADRRVASEVSETGQSRDPMPRASSESPSDEPDARPARETDEPDPRPAREIDEPVPGRKKQTSGSEPLHGPQRTDVLSAIASMTSGFGSGSRSREAARRTLSRFGDRAVATLVDEVVRGNLNEPTEGELKDRLQYIDALGQVAGSHPLALQGLKNFVETPLDRGKSRRLIHMDIMDRLEAFEFIAKEDPEYARRFVQGLTNSVLRGLYLDHLYVGFKLGGDSHEKALARTRKVVRSLDKKG